MDGQDRSADRPPEAFRAEVAEIAGPVAAKRWGASQPRGSTRGDRPEVPPFSYLAEVLWRRGWRDLTALAGWLDPSQYRQDRSAAESAPVQNAADPLAAAGALAEEMTRAIDHLVRAIDQEGAVVIWGDSAPDGLTATAVLWLGLRPLLGDRLRYHIPDRLQAGSGLPAESIDALAAAGVTLLITADMPSPSGPALAAAASLGVDVIVIDHHSLPRDRLPVVAIVNSRYLPADHPWATLPGVGLAYKLIEGLYARLSSPASTTQPNRLNPDQANLDPAILLDVVAIGLVSDLVELRGEARYLAQVGIEQLKHQAKQGKRPGLAALLKCCQDAGDRPLDPSQGIGPRLNALSQLYGDPTPCFDLLVSDDRDRCQALAQESERANLRCKELQNQIGWQVQTQLKAIDRSTTPLIVLSEIGWPVGVLGLVAADLADQVNRPVILLSLAGDRAQGVGRSPLGWDWYDLLTPEAAWLESWSGHPLAIDLALPTQNIALLQAALSRRLREGGRSLGDYPTDEDKGLKPLARGHKPLDPAQVFGAEVWPPGPVDLVLSIATLNEIGPQNLFRELDLLSPYGLGHPAPRFLIHQAHLDQSRHSNWWAHGQKCRYIVTQMLIRDGQDLENSQGKTQDNNQGKTRENNQRNNRENSQGNGIRGIWWGHYADELPKSPCDLWAELDYSPRAPIADRHHLRSSQRQLSPDLGPDQASKGSYELRLLAVRPSRVQAVQPPTPNTSIALDQGHDPRPIAPIQIIDARVMADRASQSVDRSQPAIILDRCPPTWQDLTTALRTAIDANQPLILAYGLPPLLNPEQVWRQLVWQVKNHLQNHPQNQGHGAANLANQGDTAGLSDRDRLHGHLRQTLDLSDQTIGLGLVALHQAGWLDRRFLTLNDPDLDNLDLESGYLEDSYLDHTDRSVVESIEPGAEPVEPMNAGGRSRLAEPTGPEAGSGVGCDRPGHDPSDQPGDRPGETPIDPAALTQAIATFLAAVQEESFRRRYFYQLSAHTWQEFGQRMLAGLGVNRL